MAGMQLLETVESRDWEPGSCCLHAATKLSLTARSLKCLIDRGTVVLVGSSWVESKGRDRVEKGSNGPHCPPDQLRKPKLSSLRSLSTSKLTHIGQGRPRHLSVGRAETTCIVRANFLTRLTSKGATCLGQPKKIQRFLLRLPIHF
jgi:hypothetical protein